MLLLHVLSAFSMLGQLGSTYRIDYTKLKLGYINLAFPVSPCFFEGKKELVASCLHFRSILPDDWREVAIEKLRGIGNLVL